jgi:hypothetical protein
MHEPIRVFKSIEQAVACLKEWQSRLFLDDWIINVKLCRQCDMCEEGNAGENEYQAGSKRSVIRIATDYDQEGFIEKVCHEKILVHELLHCKYNWVMVDPDNYIAHYFDTMDHALLEQMAKTLIMVKYDLPFEWFKNF